jgi:LytR cell envelope-related transcriptional attenuator
VSNSTRSTNSYDERYVVPLEASRRGAHRARVSPVMAVLPVVAVAGVVVGAIALVYLVFGGLGASSTSSQAVTTPATTSTPTSSAAASSSAAQPTASAGPSDTGTVDKTISVAVYNASGISGQARRAGDKLTGAGWTLGPIQTWTGAETSVTTVYYGSDQQRASALAVVKALGHGTVKLSAARAGTGMTVLIGRDFSSAGGATTTRAHSSSSTPARSSSPAGTSPKSSSPPASASSTASPTN